MLHNPFRRIVFPAAAALLLAACAVSAALAKPLLKASSQSDYPELHTPTFALMVDLSFPEYVDCAELIVDATVEEVLPEKTVTYTPEPGSGEEKEQEKWGTEYVFQQLVFKLKVNEVWAGTLDSDSVTLYIPPLLQDSVPDFQPGDRMVFFLETLHDGYSPSSTKGSIYYIAHDNKIYPTLLADTLEDYSGKRLRDFKRDVQETWAQKETPSEQ